MRMFATGYAGDTPSPGISAGADRAMAGARPGRRVGPLVWQTGPSDFSNGVPAVPSRLSSNEATIDKPYVTIAPNTRVEDDRSELECTQSDTAATGEKSAQ